MPNVNPQTVFELDEIFARLKAAAFLRNDFSFFRKYQKFIENSTELSDHCFFPDIVFREGNIIYPQKHEYSFKDLLKRNKGKSIPFHVGLRVKKIETISEVGISNVSSVAITEEELLGTLYCLLKGEAPFKLDTEKYFYFYSVSENGKFSKVWINWKIDYWSFKSDVVSSTHQFTRSDILLGLHK